MDIRTQPTKIPDPRIRLPTPTSHPRRLIRLRYRTQGLESSDAHRGLPRPSPGNQVLDGYSRGRLLRSRQAMHLLLRKTLTAKKANQKIVLHWHRSPVQSPQDSVGPQKRGDPRSDRGGVSPSARRPQSKKALILVSKRLWKSDNSKKIGRR
jgi:hypothetical protein